MPFYILYAGMSIGLSGQTLGILTFVFTISGTISNLAWGYLADRKGFRLVFLLSIILWMFSTLLLMFITDYYVTIAVFIGIGAAVQGFDNSSQNMTLEFGDRENLPMRIAIANSAAEVAGTIGPLLGGILAATLGYHAVFTVSIAFLFIGGLMVRFFVPEPRNVTHP